MRTQYVRWMFPKVLFPMFLCLFLIGCTGKPVERDMAGRSVIRAVAGQGRFGKETLDRRLQKIVTLTLKREELEGEWAVFVKGLVSGRSVRINAESGMRAASLIKLYVAGAVYEHMELVESQEEEDGETEELLRDMISISDNDAVNTLVLRLGDGNERKGMRKVNKYCAEYGYKNTYMGHLLRGRDEVDNNYTSVADCGQFLEDIYEGRLKGSEEILEWMRRQTRVGKIPAGLPEGTASANKTGELADVENDVAIVWGKEESYILCVMSDQLDNPEKARRDIQEISITVHEEFTK